MSKRKVPRAGECASGATQRLAPNDDRAPDAAPEQDLQSHAGNDAPPKRHARGDATRRIILKDQRLGPRQADATHWRCRRLDEEGDRKGTPLVWDEDGIRVGEWPIKSCSPETISERWGPGRYVVDYMRIDESGKRKPRGTSRLLH